MGGACRTHKERGKKMYTKLKPENLNSKDNLGNLIVDIRIILK
jgi:hypothetical protein